MRSRLAVLALAAAALVPGSARAAASPGRDSLATPTLPATTRVSYLAGGSVYVEAGRADGLAEGDTLQVIGEGRVRALLVVRYLSSQRGVCDTLRAEALPNVGDVIRYRARPIAARSRTALEPPAIAPSAPPADATDPVPAADSTRATVPARRPIPRVRGRVGLRYLLVDPSAGGGYSQPALDLRLEGRELAGAPVDVAIDVRSRRTFHAAPGAADHGEARVYRLAATVHDGAGRRRLTVGRQFPGAFAALGTFDGALAEIAGQHWSGGVFSGAEPDPFRLTPSADILQHGAYLARHGRRGAARWSVAGGGVASFDRGQVNRQFAFLNASWLEPRLMISLLQELDLNTAWKRSTGAPTIEPTSTFLSARVQVRPGWSLDGGFDDRRDVRLWRDRETPETEFDDRHRSGAWLGTGVDWAGHFRVAADGRWSDGTGAGAATVWSATAEARRLTALQGDLRWRSARFDGDWSRGWLHTASASVRPWGTSRMEIHGGVRASEEGPGANASRLQWGGADLDLGFARRWYVLLSGERSTGDGVADVQGTFSLSWLF
jgi:hypothetical protein